MIMAFAGKQGRGNRAARLYFAVDSYGAGYQRPGWGGVYGWLCIDVVAKLF